jgi:energy-coupling factor transporter transmembrane protein EcfT
VDCEDEPPNSQKPWQLDYSSPLELQPPKHYFRRGVFIGSFATCIIMYVAVGVTLDHTHDHGLEDFGFYGKLAIFVVAFLDESLVFLLSKLPRSQPLFFSGMAWGVVIATLMFAWFALVMG